MTNTLTISRELAERLDSPNSFVRNAARETLRRIIAAPAVERQPDAWGDLDADTCDEDRMLITDKDAAEVYDRQCYKLTPLFTSPPAPVAAPSDEMVQLLQRASIYARGEFLAEINACLDKVKEMNR